MRDLWTGSRRRLSLVLLLSGGLLLVAACAPAPQTEEVDREPASTSHQPFDRYNVILVTLDTLRADRLSSYGSDVQTPHLDRLATEGVRFTNASTTVAFTLPAHSSMMTGTYPPHHGVRENVGGFLADENQTLAELLNDAGWQTAAFVSAFVLDSQWGIAQGFDHYFDDFELGAYESANLGSVQRPGDETIGAALSWLDSRDEAARDRPFFLWLHLYDPHDPYTPPEPYRSQYPGRPYDAEVAYTDHLVGGLVEALEQRGLLDQSLLTVTSDHGEGLGDHGEVSHGFFVYDSTVHVPLIMRLPNSEAAGEEVHEAVSHVDLAPTILEAFGLDIPETIQGSSLLPLIRGTAPDSEERRVYAESFYPLLHYGWAPLRVLRTQNEKYIEAPRPELFDLTTDPNEQSDLSRDRRGRLREMSRELIAFADELESGAVATQEADLDEDTLSRLSALGYLAGPGGRDPSDYEPSADDRDPKEAIHLHRRIMLAQARAGEGQDSEAAKLLEEALVEDPNLLDAHQMLGDIALRSDALEAAATHFEHALAIDDRHTASLFGLATSHRRLGRIDDALLGFHRLLDISGRDTKATLAIADLEMERGDPTAAERALREALGDESPAWIHNRLGEVQTLAGESEAARSSFEEAIRKAPELSQPYFNLAVLLERSGDLTGATRRYEQAIERGPKHFQAQFNLSRIAAASGDSSRERELLEQSIASNPSFALGRFMLGKNLMEAGRLEEAEAVTREGLELSGSEPLGHFVLADVLNRQGHRQEAEAAAARGRELAAEGG